MKSYTDIEQSKKLAEILLIESADMFYHLGESQLPNVIYGNHDDFKGYLPCWSLTALLNILPKETVYNKNIVFLEFHVLENSLEYVNNADYTLYVTNSYNNAIDACYEMILKLHELNLL